MDTINTCKTLEPNNKYHIKQGRITNEIIDYFHTNQTWVTEMESQICTLDGKTKPRNYVAWIMTRNTKNLVKKTKRESVTQRKQPRSI